jgi:hypothetical protein
MQLFPGRNDPSRFVAGDDWDRPPASEPQFGVFQFGDSEGGREIALGTARVDLYLSVKRILSAFRDAFPAHLGGCDVSDC